MIIDKLQPFWTEEDRTALENIQRAQENFIADLQRKNEQGILEDNILTKWKELDNKRKSIISDVEDRYIKSFRRNKKGILADVEEIVEAVEREDFQTRIREQLSQLAVLKKEKLPEHSLDTLKEFATENYNNCYDFIMFHLRVQLNALAFYAIDTEEAKAIVEKRVALWYVKPTPNYFTMAHGKATDALAFMSSKNAEVNPITKTATIDKFDVQLSILKFEELHATLGISTDKLLSTAIATFTQRNDFRHKDSGKLNREVTIPLREYAELLGYDVTEHSASTPEEAEAEKKRAKNQLDNARKAIKKDLLTIQASSLTWEEKVKGKPRDFESISLVTRVGIRNGEIRIAFSPEIAEYLSQKNLITQYPTKLLRISGRQPTAYYIGRKLAEHYNMDNNQIRGTHDRISIPALLAVTELPSYEDVMKQDRHWDRRIKEPLEQALDTLTQEGVLKNWEYTHSKGVPLTDEEASTITSYSDFESLYLHFTPADTVDHTDRLQAKKERKEKKTKKKKN